MDDADCHVSPLMSSESFSDILGYRAKEYPVLHYKFSALHCIWRGSVIQKIWKTALLFGLFTALIFYFITTTMLDKSECHYSFDSYNATYDDTICRPDYFDVLFGPLAVIHDNLNSLNHFTLAFYLTYAYHRYNSFYWSFRHVQAHIEDIALLIGTSVLHTTEKGKEYLDTFERYLNLLHFIAHSRHSPVLMNMDIFPEEDESRESVLVKREIMGMMLCTTEEYRALVKANTIGGPSGAQMALLVWMDMLFDRITSSMEDCDLLIESSKGRSVAITRSFQTKLESLRAGIMCLRYNVEIHRPLGYAQYIQLFTDIMCIMMPFVMIYKFNNNLISLVGYKHYDRWSALALVLLANLLYSYFHQGLVAVARELENPLGKMESKRIPGELAYKEIFIEIRSILREARGIISVLMRVQHLSPCNLNTKVENQIPDPSVKSLIIAEERSRSQFKEQTGTMFGARQQNRPNLSALTR